MLEMWRQNLDEPGAQALQCVMPTPCGGHVVGLVHHEDIELSRVTGTNRQHFSQQAQGFTTLDPVHGGDEPRERCPRVGMDTSVTAQFPNIVGVHDLELETELLHHLDAPFLLQRSRADDEH